MSGNKLEPYRLDKFLADCGVVSRRRAKEVISEGFVAVNSKKVYEPGCKVDIARDSVKFKGKKIDLVSEKKYILINKPRGIITTCKDTHDRETVLDLIDCPGLRMYPIGRLDKDTTGLLLITNDGEFAYRATHPKFELSKTYEVILNREPTAEDLKAIARGVKIDNKRTSPSRIIKRKSKTRGNPSSLFEIEIHEGRNRQIRKMFLTKKYRVKTLKRIKYGNILLGNMKVSSWRELTGKERKGIFKLLGLSNGQI